MTDDPLETVRALERSLSERLAAATGPARTVEQAQADTAALRVQAGRDADHAAARRTAQILAQADEHAEQLRTAGHTRAEELRARAQDRLPADVESVLAAVLPDTRHEGRD